MADVLGRSTEALLKHLQDIDAIRALKIRQANYPSTSKGGYTKDSREVEILGGIPDQSDIKALGLSSEYLKTRPGDTAAWHEVVHALSMNAPSRAEGIARQVAELDNSPVHKIFGSDLVYPSHWENRQVESSDYPRGLNQSTMYGLMRETENKRQQDVLRQIPEGHSWSGLQKEMTPSRMDADDLQEVQAHYLTNERLGNPEGRMKEYMLFLRDRGVPWNIIDRLKNEYVQTGKMSKELTDRVNAYMKERGLTLR